MTFSAIVVSHANPSGLRKMLGNLRYQTRPPDETIVLCSDTPDVARLREEFEDVEFLERPNHNDWGHEKRAEGLDRATGDWLGFFNDDDSYDRTYIARMLRAARVFPPGTVDVVYCNWNIPMSGSHSEDFRLGRSTSGNFIAMRDLAQEVGWTGRHYEADGEFINALADSAFGIAFVPERLYFHNAQ